MRALLAALLTLAVPAAAAAGPLDPDRGFGRNGVVRLDEISESLGVIALADGSTLHAARNGFTRVTAGGRRTTTTPLPPSNPVLDLATTRGGATAVGLRVRPEDVTADLATWRIGADGTPRRAATIPMPAGTSAFPQRVVRRPGGSFALVISNVMDPDTAEWIHRVVIVALTPGAELDTTWGEKGFRVLPYGAPAIGADRRGGLVVARGLPTRCSRLGYSERKERARVRLQRFDAGGTSVMTRTLSIGLERICPDPEPGEVLLDSRGRPTIGLSFGATSAILRLRRDFTRDRRFGRAGLATISRRGAYTPVRLERLSRGRYAFAVTVTDQDSLPSALVGMADARGRKLRRRRLAVTRSHPHSRVDDIVIDRRRGIVAAGALYDTNVAIREDYGQAHLAVWRLRTR